MPYDGSDFYERMMREPPHSADYIVSEQMRQQMVDLVSGYVAQRSASHVEQPARDNYMRMVARNFPNVQALIDRLNDASRPHVRHDPQFRWELCNNFVEPEDLEPPQWATVGVTECGCQYYDTPYGRIYGTGPLLRRAVEERRIIRSDAQELPEDFR